MEPYLFGVSPAFFLSLCGTDFLPRDLCAALPLVRRLGFDSFQVELYSTDKLSHWLCAGAQETRDAAEHERLKVSQIVAHFLLPAFETEEAVLNGWDEARVAEVFGIAAQLCPGVTVTVPLGPYRGKGTPEAKAALIRRLRSVAMEGARRGFPVALEIQPHALVQGAEGIRTMLDEIGYGIGYNLDSGHAWAMGERVEQYPRLLEGRILGTHLCDNDGVDNQSLCPGEGTIDFPALARGLAETGYRGSYDLEIFVEQGMVEEAYRKGLRFLRDLLGAGPMRGRVS